MARGTRGVAQPREVSVGPSHVRGVQIRRWPGPEVPWGGVWPTVSAARVLGPRAVGGQGPQGAERGLGSRRRPHAPLLLCPLAS